MILKEATPIGNRNAQVFMKNFRLKFTIITCLVALNVLLMCFLLRSAMAPSNPAQGRRDRASFPIETLSKRDRLKCQKTRVKPILNGPPTFQNQHSRQKHQILIKNATIWDGLGQVLSSHDLLLDRGVILKIGRDLKGPFGAEIKTINAHGRILTPGIVDMHSHMGTFIWPFFSGTSDTNEDTRPIYSQLRVSDAFTLQDPSIFLAAAGGVTTSLVLPGSANIMGGEAVALKNKPRQKSINDLLLYPIDSYLESNEAQTLPLRWMKMALGENPLKSGNGYPATRMGAAWLFRERLSQALKLKEKQDRFCSSPSPDTEFPENIELESLVALLRGQVLLNTHVYTIQDIETLFRISHEFELPIAALHHATSAYLAADSIAKERARPGSINVNLTMALFADKGYYKHEAYYASTKAPLVLKKHGIPYAIKSDHPVTNAQFLAWNAFKTINYALSKQDALSAITSVPARALGIADKVGSIREGLHADLLIWNHDLAMVGSRPLFVMIDGEIFVNVLDDDDEKAKISEQVSSKEMENDFNAGKFCESLLKPSNTSEPRHFYFTNLSHIHADSNHHFESGEFIVELNFSHIDLDEKVGISQGAKILCFGANGECSTIANGLNNLQVFKLPGVVAVPNPIAANSQLGLVEISKESETKAGNADPGKFDPIVMNGGLSVIDGLEFGRGLHKVADGGFSKMIEIASLGGVSMALAVPRNSESTDSIVRGISALINTNSGSVSTGGVVEEEVGIHVSIGKNYVRPRSIFSGINGQVAYLENILLRALEGSQSTENAFPPGKKNRFSDVVSGKLPLFVHVDNAEQISALLRMKARIDQKSKVAMQMIIVGGAEAWMVAAEIASSPRTRLILTKVRCTPEHQDTKRCRSTSSLENPILLNGTNSANLQTSVSILREWNVTFAVATSGDNFIRDLFWEAGWTKFLSSRTVDLKTVPKATDISLHEAVGLVTWRVAEVLGLENKIQFSSLGRNINNQSNPSFLLYFDGHPVETSRSKILLDISTFNPAKSEFLIKCEPTQL